MLKKSNYNINLELKDEKNILYNTFSRKYLIYGNSEKVIINSLLNNINRNEYTKEEFVILKEMILKNIIVSDDLMETDKIEVINNKYVNSNKNLILTIQPTLDCNFRCVYCYEDHKKTKLSIQSQENIIKYVENNIKGYDGLIISWFGGEPLLEFQTIYSLTDKFKDICFKNNVEYKAFMTTNGYLFNDAIVESLEKLDIKAFQITVDGYKDYHNEKRPLINGQGTYDKIINNITKLVKSNVKVNLRVNVDDRNISSIEYLLNEFPPEYRKYISIHPYNIFQSKEKVNTFKIYKKIIEKGFLYSDTKNTFHHCEVCIKSSFIIDPNCNVAPCSMAAEEGFFYGKINEHGKLILDNQGLFYSLKNISPFKNSKCKECIELPMCMGGCPFSRYKNPSACSNKNSGLSIHDRIKLHYYYDTKSGGITSDDEI